MPYCRGKKWIRQCCILTHLNTEIQSQLCLQDAPGKPPLQQEGEGPFFSYWKCAVCSSFPGIGTDGRKNDKGAGNPGRIGRIEDAAKTQPSPCIRILHLGMTSRSRSIYRQPAHVWKPKRAFAGVMLPHRWKVKVCPNPVPVDSGSRHPEGMWGPQTSCPKYPVMHSQRSRDQSVVAHNPNWIPKFTSITVPNLKSFITGHTDQVLHNCLHGPNHIT